MSKTERVTLPDLEPDEERQFTADLRRVLEFNKEVLESTSCAGGCYCDECTCGRLAASLLERLDG